MRETLRFEEELEEKVEKVEKYLEANRIKFSHLVNMAVSKFISNPQTIKLAPVNTAAFTDGNKRTGTLVAITFLNQHGMDLQYPIEDLDA